MKKKILCFGELLFRISPASNEEVAGKHPMKLYMGGAEANVATALAGWNLPVKYCTALPDNFMSRHILNYLEYKGIFTSSIHFSGKRIGLYYLERGADLKGSMVYDRDDSSFALLKPGMIDWDRVLQDVCWLNLSAISPALNANVAAVCLEAVQAAAGKGITVSMDLNYRNRLWNYGVEPVTIMKPMAAYCHVLMGNIWSANSLLGIPVDEQIHAKGTREDYLQHAAQTAQHIRAQFPACHTIANTFRFDGNNEQIVYYTALQHHEQFVYSQPFSCAGVIDRSGSGDCYMAGLIYGLYHGHAPQDIVNFATAAAFGKLQEQGDATDQDVFTIEERKNKMM